MAQSTGAVRRRAYRFAAGVTLRIHSSQHAVLNHFASEYTSAAIEEPDVADIEVYAGKKVIASSPEADRLSRAYEGRHKIVRWRVGISGLCESTTHVGFEGNGSLVISFLQTFYVEPLLRLKFAARDHALVHAASLAKDELSVLFPAGSRVGKSTMTLQHAAAGQGVQGDNYVILTGDGRTLTFPRRMRVYSDLPAINPEVYAMLSRRERIRLRWAGIIRRLSAGYANLPRRLGLEQIVGNGNGVCREARLRAVYLLKPYQGEGLSDPLPQTADEAIERIQEIGEMESLRLREALPDDQPASLMQPILQRERDVLKRALSDIPIFELLVPRVRNPSPLVAQIRQVAGLAGTADDPP
jgi:hypothetical protein